MFAPSNVEESEDLASKAAASEVMTFVGSCLMSWSLDACLQAAAEALDAAESSAQASNTMLRALCDTTVELDSNFRMIGDNKRLIQMFPSTFAAFSEKGLDGSDFQAFLQEGDRARFAELVKQSSVHTAGSSLPLAMRMRLTRNDSLMQEIDIHLVRHPSSSNGMSQRSTFCYLLGIKAEVEAPASAGMTECSFPEVQQMPTVSSKSGSSSSSVSTWTAVSDDMTRSGVKNISMEVNAWTEELDIISAKINFDMQGLQGHFAKPTLSRYVQKESILAAFKEWLQFECNELCDGGPGQAMQAPPVVLHLPGNCGALLCGHAEIRYVEAPGVDDAADSGDSVEELEEEDAEKKKDRSTDPDVYKVKIVFSDITVMKQKRGARFSLQRFRAQQQRQLEKVMPSIIEHDSEKNQGESNHESNGEVIHEIGSL
eukprot:TRINITY_DN15107_c0_g2_i2.p1 TRINITY_DN15107_c0_g2~~TRINITY_DN15107_c0_g2_i2.p1  ORF type:complete len:428 (+),score=87.98 TRINITY_DN15107_c0_g2_i2:2-1285(+)